MCIHQSLYASLNCVTYFIPLWILFSDTVLRPPLSTLLDESLIWQYGPRRNHPTTCPLRAENTSVPHNPYVVACVLGSHPSCNHDAVHMSSGH